MSTGGAGGQYRINIVWTSHGGQALATMGQIQSAQRQMGATSLREGRNLGYFNRQMQAMGTTMRYFFAGGAIFGTMGAFNQFAEFEGKLGGLAALAPELEKKLTNMGRGFLRSSSEIATPVTEIEDSARNILSTMQLTTSEMDRFLPQWTTLFSKGAKISETDAYNFGNAVMGMNRAFQRDLGQMENTAGQFFTVIQRSAGMTGDEWAKFSGRVVAGGKIAGAQLEEVNALMVLMTRQGGTAATNVRHMAQMLQQLRNPTKESIPFWESIGLPVEQLRTLPFDQILNRLVEAVRQRGGLTPGAVMPEESILALEELGSDATLDMMGMKGGGAALLMDLFGRIESRRAAGVVISEILAGARPGSPSYKQVLDELKDIEKQNENVDKSFARWLDRNRIQQAGQALRNMMTEALIPAEDQIMGISARIAEWADPRLVQGAAAAVAGYGIYRLGRYGKGALQGAGRWARGLGTAGMAVNQLGNPMPPTGSFSNPLWVVIHPLSNVPGLGGRGPGGLPIPGKGGKGPGGTRIPVTTLGTKALGTAGLVLMLPNSTGETDEMEGRRKLLEEIGKNPAKYPNLVRLWNTASAGGAGAQALGQNERSVLYSLMGGKNTATNLERALVSNLQNTGRFFELYRPLLSGDVRDRSRESKARVEIALSPEAKKLLYIKPNEGVFPTASRDRVHVPVGHSAWSGGPTPQFRGTSRTYRGPH